MASKYFDCEDDEAENIIAQYEQKKRELEEYLKKEKCLTEFSDDYYEENIPDEETKMMLSDGLYTITEVEKLTKKCTPTFRKKVLKKINSTKGCIITKMLNKKNIDGEEHKKFYFGIQKEKYYEKPIHIIRRRNSRRLSCHTGNDRQWSM